MWPQVVQVWEKWSAIHDPGRIITNFILGFGGLSNAVLKSHIFISLIKYCIIASFRSRAEVRGRDVEVRCEAIVPILEPKRSSGGGGCRSALRIGNHRNASSLTEMHLASLKCIWLHRNASGLAETKISGITEIHLASSP
jgi:hypothetical protein